ncbi:MAG: protein-L-isoaspartate(D-aspartate) O-methyltransferase [Solirubrobacteraceae bacterium]|jgi:protein-L-isoaspartate(D-aspartate) O-methyltransferase|nr:protein-L-isoaspartate(D-aspartate) O-methyltransferase [Solirubrobacteraceae bacterium]
MSAVDRLVGELRPHVRDERVLAAITRVPREAFVPEKLRSRAYDNTALGIDCGQTISQPLVVARMAALLELQPDDRVLDVGTGSGYHAAILAALARHVWSIERHPGLSRTAGAALARAGVANVTLIVGDGCEGLPEQAPFDAINVAAAGGRDALATLEAQLARGGRLVAPVTGHRQRLHVARRGREAVSWRELEEVRFVPLVRGD